MSQKKTENTLDRLQPSECAQVLRELLKRHRELRGEADEIAKRLIDEISAEAIADEVAFLVRGVGIEALNDRAGRHSWGYTEPSEAAWELLEESIADVQTDMKRRFEAGMKPAAEKICQGLVLGLHAVDEATGDGVLGWAPDFPAEAAAWSLSLLLELYPQRSRRAAGNRVLKAVAAQAADWTEMLEKVVSKSVSKKKGSRR